MPWNRAGSSKAEASDQGKRGVSRLSLRWAVLTSLGTVFGGLLADYSFQVSWLSYANPWPIALGYAFIWSAPLAIAQWLTLLFFFGTTLGKANRWIWFWLPTTVCGTMVVVLSELLLPSSCFWREVTQIHFPPLTAVPGSMFLGLVQGFLLCRILGIKWSYGMLWTLFTIGGVLVGLFIAILLAPPIHVHDSDTSLGPIILGIGYGISQAIAFQLFPSSISKIEKTTRSSTLRVVGETTVVGVVLALVLGSILELAFVRPENFVSYSRFALMDSIRAGDTERVKKIVASCADVNEKAADGSGPLLTASGSGRVEIVKVLVANGADVNAKDKGGFTPLIYSAQLGSTEIVNLLISNGADVNITNQFGWSALLAASTSGSTEVVKQLIDNGADVGAKTKDGRTAIQITKEKGHSEIVELLMESGAKE